MTAVLWKALDGFLSPTKESYVLEKESKGEKGSESVWTVVTSTLLLKVGVFLLVVVVGGVSGSSNVLQVGPCVLASDY